MRSQTAATSFRDTGIDWLGTIPCAWKMLPLKRLARIQNGRDYKEVAAEDGAIPVIGSGGEFARATKPLFSGESVLLGRKGTIDKPLYINGPFWPVDTMFYTRIDKDADGRFVYYLAKSIPFTYYSSNTALPSMAQEDLSSHVVAAPIRAVQTRIASALDRETARIDALIEKKTRFIELLKEKRQALITQAVTKGLDPNVSMKDSGVEWIGEVPAHWEARKIKTLFRLNCKKSGKDHGEQLLSVYTEIGVRPRAELEERGNKASTTDDYLIVRRGDLVVNIILAWMGAIGHSAYDGVTSPAYDILTPGTSTFSPFYHFYLRRPEASTEIKRWSKGIMDMRLRIYFEQLGQIFVPHPPLQEQKDIVAFVESEGVRIGRLVDMTTRSIELLKERRSALITAAVTGQIDLREEAA